VKQLVRTGVRLIDKWTTGLQLATGLERPGVIALLFHHVFEDESEIARNVVLPQERVTIAQYRQIVEYFLKAGYRFVTPDHIEAGRGRDEKLVMITFDDGYADNLRILPLLHEYEIPATVFVATYFVQKQCAYWWDVVYRNRTREGATAGMIRAEEEPLTTARSDEVEAYLMREFGRYALSPETDLDRPLTLEELAELAADRLICIGNHTSNHRRLSRLAEEDVMNELTDCQAALLRLTGKSPSSLSYPYGDYSPEVMKVAAQLGFRVGITCVPVKTPVPQSFRSPRALQIGRCQLVGSEAMIPQCAQARSDVSAHTVLQRRRFYDSFADSAET
jgi:peptidoglycan/xylan/chitin deacetylase (PgdA/CDA1 family)